MSITTEAVVVLHGGGTDSHVLAWQMHKMGCDVHIIWFNIGQANAEDQLRGAQFTTRRIIADGGTATLNTQTVPALFTRLLGPYKSRVAQLNPEAEVVDVTVAQHEEVFDNLGENASYAECPGFGWVPGRNGFFLFTAAIFAAARGIYRVLWGINSEIPSLKETRWQPFTAGDDMWFPFLEGLNRWLPSAIGHPVEVVSPYIHNTKYEVMKMGLALGLTVDGDYAHLWSCEHTPRCWKCQQCHHMVDLYNALGQWPEWFPEDKKHD